MCVIIRAGRWLDKPIALVLPLTVALLWKLLWLSRGVIPFNADEAVVALMARHVLHGERPLFFYGQAYMGSLDAYLVAAGFWVFGQQVLVLRAVQALLYCGTIAALYCALREFFPSPRQAWTAALLLSLPSLDLTLYTTVSLGGYGEALLIGILALWVALHMSGHGPTLLGSALLGFLTGLGLWVFPLSAVFTLPSLVLAARTSIQRAAPRRIGLLAAALVIAALIGGTPWLIGWRELGSSTLHEILGSTLAGISSGSYLDQVWTRALNLMLFAPTVVFGLRAPWNTQLLVVPLLPLILAADLGVLLFGIAQLRVPDGRRPARWTMFASGILLILVFVATPFGSDPSGRYFLPLGFLFAVTSVELVGWLNARRPHWGSVLVGLLLFFNACSTVQAAANPPGITTQFDPETQVNMHDLPEVIRFLEQDGETRGYTNYWVEYPLAFLSQEQLLFVAKLPYHSDGRYSPRDDRYAPYDALVQSAPKVAYITTGGGPLDALLRNRFERMGVSYREEQIGDFLVFYHLSSPIAPEALRLGH